jgi:LmbE family N-acetylglucosaminyl deacetylase|tara:strand:- start:297 stop:941 length:645 start_codon:yes stop_codon:yes gene_type:complete
MKFLGFNKVLCLSPHPDDVEFGMMGTILKYNDTHFDIICLSSGGDFDDTTGQNRLQEVQNVWGNQPNVTLHFTKFKLLKELDHDAWVNFIENNFINIPDTAGYTYDCIFVPTKEDSHFEHKIVNELSFPLTRIKNISILEYRTPSTLDSWSPNTFTDITTYFDEKYNKLMKFESQKGRWYFQKDLLKSFHSNFQSYKKGIKYTEKFRLIQLYKL